MGRFFVRNDRPDRLIYRRVEIMIYAEKRWKHAKVLLQTYYHNLPTYNI